MQIDKETLQDAILIGNVNPLFSLFAFTVSNNNHLTPEEKKRINVIAQKFKAKLNNLACERIFKDLK